MSARRIEAEKHIRGLILNGQEFHAAGKMKARLAFASDLQLRKIIACDTLDAIWNVLMERRRGR